MMNIYWLQPFWFGHVTYNDTTVHVQYLTINFAGFPNIDAQVWLNVFASGAKYSNGAVTALGSTAVGFFAYTYKHPQFGTLPMLLGYGPWETRLRVEKIKSLTAWFHVRLASAKADGMVYYWNLDGARQSAVTAPRFDESHYCIFEPTTGEIVAFETVWTEEGADEATHGPSQSVLETHGKLADGRTRRLESIPIEGVPRAPMRVDPSSRALVPLAVSDSADLLPPRIELP